MSENLLLKGIKVIDAASFIAGPASTTILSDFGAEVIKIEPPKVGDSLRHLILRTRRVNPQGDKDYCWHLTSRNKKSLALDLNTSKGQEILKELIKEADVFVTNMPKKTREKLKIRAEDLLPINEDWFMDHLLVMVKAVKTPIELLLMFWLGGQEVV